MADVLDRLVKHWQRQNIAPADHTATPSEITEWESRHGVRLPDDLRKYVSKVNGFRDGELLDFDEECFSFLPLSAMQRESEWSGRPSNPSRFVIADYMIQCYWWCAELDNEHHSTTRIYRGGGATERDNSLVANSLEDFLDLYIEKSRTLHF
jgi:hypothetical protein